MDILLYMHNGSGNHGCEAIVRTTAEMLSSYGNIKLFSKRPEEDRKYIIDNDFEIIKTNEPLNTHSIKGGFAAFRIKFFHQRYAFVKVSYKSLLDSVNKDTIAISIGGDNYCYDGMPEVLEILNREINKRGGKTILWGCSIEPTLLENPSIKEDLSRYALISARESITYRALIEAGIKTKIIQVADPAFLLPAEYGKLPDDFIENNMVGINISPLVLDYSNGSNLLYRAYYTLIQKILQKTDMNVALIPHVVWEKNNDMKPIINLYEDFKNTGRILMIQDANACVLKGYISRCRFFVGARTHSTIAAYSSCIPTLVVGYSVKSIGIATDLFDNCEKYVKQINKIEKAEDLWQSFQYIWEHEEEIKQRLNLIMPSYIENANVNIDSIVQNGYRNEEN